jgi:integrase
MPRKRNPENDGLPRRWKVEHGAVYYRVPTGQEAAWDGKKTFRLGATLSEAHRTWADRIETDAIEVRTIGDLLNRYLLEVTPTKAKRTQVDEPGYVVHLKKRFGHMRLKDLEPHHIYKYFDKRKDQTKDKEGNLVSEDRKAKRQARQEIKLLSHAFTKAVEWGLIKAHPFKKEVRFDGERSSSGARERYIEDWELVEALALKPMRKRGSVRMCQAYIRLKRATGLRMTDMLLLKPSDAKDDGIHVHVSKTRHSTGRKQIFAWVDEHGNDTGRRAAWDACLTARPLDIAPWVFCTDEGECYVDQETWLTTNFNSVWKRFMDRVLKETEVKERFAERDIRAKVGCDAETVEKAAHILGSASPRIVRKHYRRKPDVIR